MKTLILYLVGFMLAGGFGMWLGSRHKERQVQSQRWLKYGVYILITILILTATWYHAFKWIILIILTAGFIELSKTIFSLRKKQTLFGFLALLIYAIIAAGAWLFADRFIPDTHLFFYLQVFIFDAFCQVTGQIFGKTQLAPSISPGKTVEGFAGGWLFCIVAAVLGAYLVQLSWQQAVLYGLLTGGIAGTGDLLASWYKRRVHIKDYSSALPGQGGFLDRFDSLLTTLAAYYFLSLAGLTIP